MKSALPGNNTLAVEVTNISRHGIWIFVHDQETFLSFQNFPWFQDAPVKKILHVEMPSERHLYWPELDVDLTIDSILHPENYPLISKCEG
ncbi:MAG: DUF2442 domain-containing protein [Trichlorobacter sp.]|uniref:DUF2442 domain-containing protein n=1 Tax=Trichlorobacter sp. TaxID=2911007 RepID=UPI00256E48AF|nr:DUF2442 domain-containing protein [Trichlorobacter sp.]MDK9717510.1 DUF2442 domain-containing protein [Trichlorobacter sp.]